MVLQVKVLVNYIAVRPVRIEEQLERLCSQEFLGVENDHPDESTDVVMLETARKEINFLLEKAWLHEKLAFLRVRRTIMLA